MPIDAVITISMCAVMMVSNDKARTPSNAGLARNPNLVNIVTADFWAPGGVLYPDLIAKLDLFIVTLVAIPNIFSMFRWRRSKLSEILQHLWGPFHYHSWYFISASISNYIHYKVWDEIIYPLTIFNGCTAEVCEWIRSFIPHLKWHVTAYPCWNLSDLC